MIKAKPFCISKRVVFKAYQRVRANQGAAGVDGESIADIDKDWKNNLYKIWNRMSSGSYFPPAVRSVGIAKKGGGQRKLGVPTVSDRIAQMVAKMYFEPEEVRGITLSQVGKHRVLDWSIAELAIFG